MTTRASQIIQFLSKLGLPAIPNNGTPKSLLTRVSDAFGTNNNFKLQHELLLSLLYTLDSLEHDVRVLNIRGTVGDEFIQSIATLKSMIGPTHWATDPAQWHSQFTVIIRDLSIVDNLLFAHGLERSVPKEEASSLADALDGACEQLASADVTDTVQLDKVINIIKILSVMFRNIDSSDLDTIIKMTLLAIFELATLKPQKGPTKKIITTVVAILGGAFVLAGQIREAVDTASFVRDVATVVSDAIATPKLVGTTSQKALPAPDVTPTEQLANQTGPEHPTSPAPAS